MISVVDDNKSQYVGNSGSYIGNQVFKDFAISNYSIDKKPTLINNVFFVYDDFHFKAYDNNNVMLIDHELPRVFNMRPVWLGIHLLNGQEVIVAANVSRATTGKYFLGIWQSDGTLIYGNILSSHYRYHFVNIQEPCFIFNSYREVRRICQRPNTITPTL